MMNLILTLSNILFPLITFPYASRVLLPEGMGKVAFATFIMAFFIMFASFGVETYGIRAIAQVRESKDKLTKTTQEILVINLFFTIVAYLIFFIVLAFNERLNAEFVLFACMSSAIFFSIISVEWFYKGIEQYGYITLRSVIFKTIALVLVFTLVKSRDDYIYFGVISIVAIIGSGIVNFFNLRKYLAFKLYADYNFAQHLKPMFILFLTGVSVAFYSYVDAIMLGFFAGDEEVGYFYVASRIKGILLALLTSLGAVLLPRLSYFVQHQQMSEFNYVLNKSMNLIFLTTIPSLIFCFFFAEYLILILVGSHYLASILPLKIIIFSVFIIGINNIFNTQIMIPLGKDFFLLLSVAIGAIVSVTFNMYLIPKYFSVGAAIVAVVTEVVVLGIQAYLLAVHKTPLFKGIQYFKILIATAFAVMMTIILDHAIEVDVLVLKILILGTVFFSVYLAFLLLLKEKLSNELFASLKAKLR